MHQLLDKVIGRITLYSILSFISCFSLASNQPAISDISVSNMTQGVISYSYDITDGTESSAPRLKATLQFNESADIDEVIFILRSNAGTSRLHRIANFSATNSGSNTWTLDEPLSATANGSYEYYLNFAYKSGENGSDFNGMSSMPGDGTKWSNLIPTFAAEDNGYLSQADPRFTFSNPGADTEDPSFSHYISSIEGSDPSETFSSAQDAALITGNDGDLNTPIIVKLKAVFSEPVNYATDQTYVYFEEGGSYTSYNDASIQVDGNTVTYSWSFDSKTPLVRLRPYLFAYDYGLNRTYRRDTIEFTNILADTSQPTLQSISIIGRVGDNQEKYIDYDLQFDATDVGTANMKEIGLLYRGPNCNSIYTRLHDYNLDPSLLPGQYKGSWRILDNNPYGIYRISGYLYIHDQQLNRRFYNINELKNDFLLTGFSLQKTADNQQAAVSTIYCPAFSESLDRIYFATNSTNIVASYENTIQDGKGNIITPRFGLSGDDAGLFNISASGVITFKSPPDYDNPIDADADNNYELTAIIYAADSSDATYISDDNHSVGDAFTVLIDTDNDSDGVADSVDAFPLDASESTDTDNDGIGNNADPDDDNDGTADAFDAFPLDNTEIRDNDSDGVGNNADFDDDNDGTPDTSDLFPNTDYESPLLESSLEISKYGIVGLELSAVEDPSFALGYTPNSFSLSSLGYYLQSGKSTTLGVWSKIGEGYSLDETVDSTAAYPIFDSSGNYVNINWSGLGISPGESLSGSPQFEVVYRNSHRFAVIQKGSDRWQLAYQEITKTFATNADYPVALDPSLPIKVSRSEISTFEILSPERSVVPFEPSNLEGTWMIGGILNDDVSLASDCLLNNPNPCGDLITLNADGSGIALRSERSLAWSLQSDESLRITFSDNSSVFSIRQIAKDAETSSVLLSGAVNGKYFAQIQLMMKRHDSVPSVSELLLNKYLVTGPVVTSTASALSPIDNKLIDFFGFYLSEDGTGERIYVYAPSGLSPSEDGIVASSDITWTYANGTLKIDLCNETVAISDGTEVCAQRKRRIWELASVTESRMYALEIIKNELDNDLDGVYETFLRSVSRPNFYEWHSTFDIDDYDRDGIKNDEDLFPFDSTEWTDLDGDGVGDNSDTDIDGDGVPNGSDGFPLISLNGLTDTDNDGLPDECDADCIAIGMTADIDDDGDGVADIDDEYPLLSLDGATDTDGDGSPDDCDSACISIGMNADPDDDNDGTEDSTDAFPLDSTEIRDNDSDGLGDNADTDDDNDGIPDSQDLYPFEDYQTALLASDLSSSPFGIINYKKSAIEDPSVQMGYVSMSFSLSPLGFYFESGKSTTLGNWSSVAEGYLLSETINSTTSYLMFGSDNYQNINWSGLGLSPSDPLGGSGQFEVVYRNKYRLAVVEKGHGTWKLAYQRIISTYATNANYNIAINKNLPIKIERSDITEFDILAPDRVTVPFDNSEISGTWVIGGILEDDISLASDCLSDGYSCSDLITFNADGSAEALRSGRNLTWILQQDGSVRLSFIDNGSVFFIRRIEKDAETSSVMVSGAVNGKYFSQIQLMIKRQDAVPSVSDLLLNKYLVNGFTVTATQSVRSPADNKVVDFFGFNLYEVGNGKRIVVTTPNDVYSEGYLSYNEISWTYSSGILEIELCYNTSANSGGTQVCAQRQHRTWKLVSVTESRMYVLEILKSEVDADLDGVYEQLNYSFSRPNFYEWHTTFSLEDYDRDGVLNDNDLFPYDGSEWADLDGDGVGNNADSDADGDGVNNVSDAFPRDASETLDTDNDGVGNSADTDDDNDGVSDTWTLSQLGSDIDGDSEHELASRIALSGDGTTLAVGSWGANSYTGFVRIFKWNSSSADWIQHGSTIYGEYQYDYTGYSISLSHDGSVVAIDASGRNVPGLPLPNQAGYVRIFAWDGQDWSQRGNKIEGEFAGDACCYLSLSADGSTIALASQKSVGSSNLTNIGQTRVFSWDGTNWGQKGFGIDGEAENDRSGRWATSLSSDGLSLAIGARNNEANGPDFTGHVRVYEWTDNAWIQRGQDVDGESGGDYSGNSASLSSDGRLLAIGAPGNDGSGPNAGHVRVYGWSDSSSTWIQKGQDIDGDSSACDDSKEYTDTDGDGITDSCGEESGWASDLSSDGSTLAIGAWKNDDNGEDSGTTRIYGWDEPSQLWVQRADDIDGEAAGDHSGYQTAVSSDGSVVATSAWGNTGAAGYRESGHVRVFKLSGPADAFPLDATETTDTDSDGIGNNADPDDDGDGVADGSDAFPLISLNGLTDADADGRPDECDADCLATGMIADTDDDNDGVLDIEDAFPLDANESIDTDSDGIGNNADTDDDGDGVADELDAFPLISLNGLTDTDGDGRPNDCDASCLETGMTADTDDDGDGVADESDAFPLISLNGLTDTDGDGRPNDCDESCLETGMTADTDDDGDGVTDESDAFPLISLNGLTDTDGDGMPNLCDASCLETGMTEDLDDDGDGVLDEFDNYPGISLGGRLDTDGDGRPDECDAECEATGMTADMDDDDDQVLDVDDAFPLDATESVDTDSDGIGNNADTDDDNDGVPDVEDAFPLDASESLDTDLDGLGNNEDNDDDNDGVLDNEDAFPLDASEYLDTDSDGIGNNADTDDDNDGVPDINDTFPLDANESIDTDSDGIGNNADTDDDGDGVEDANDSSPLDPTNDSDGDGVANIDDAYPENSLYSKDSDGDGMPDAWEVTYGLDPNDSSDATSDRDNDGVSALDEFLAGTPPSGSIDLDGNEQYDALTDGLLLLRGMFGLDGAALITGTLASDAVYTDPEDIESRIEILGDLADVDGNGQIDALTDGLLTLRYLFGLEGDILVNGVVAADATRTTAEEIEAHLQVLMPSL